MNKKIFGEGSNWYFQPVCNYLGMNECVTFDQAKKGKEAATNYVKNKYINRNPEDTRIDFFRDDFHPLSKYGKERTYREGKDYFCPIILFSKGCKLLVVGNDVEDNSKCFCDIPDDFSLIDYNMDNDISDAINIKFGVTPKKLHYIGSRSLENSCHTDSIPLNEDGEFIQWDQDILLCTEWDGEITGISLEEDEELLYKNTNEFSHDDLYGDASNYQSSLLVSLTSETGNYVMWANLLLHLLGEVPDI